MARPTTKDEWLIEIEKEFYNQTPEQLGQLLQKAEKYCSEVEMIYNIIGNIKKTGNISFNQWKAIRAELKQQNNPIKKLN